jgi:hypothetical protein
MATADFTSHSTPAEQNLLKIKGEDRSPLIIQQGPALRCEAMKDFRGNLISIE